MVAGTGCGFMRGQNLSSAFPRRSSHVTRPVFSPSRSYWALVSSADELARLIRWAENCLSICGLFFFLFVTFSFSKKIRKAFFLATWTSLLTYKTTIRTNIRKWEQMVWSKEDWQECLPPLDVRNDEVSPVSLWKHMLRLLIWHDQHFARLYIFVYTITMLYFRFRRDSS